MFENRVERRMVWLKRDKVTGKWRKEHSEEIKDLHCSPNSVRVIKLRRMKLAEHVARMVNSRRVYRVLLWKPEGKGLLGGPRSKWENNIKMYLQEVRCGDIDWIKLAQDRDRWRTLENAVMNLQVP